MTNLSHYEAIIANNTRNGNTCPLFFETPSITFLLWNEFEIKSVTIIISDESKNMIHNDQIMKNVLN